MADFRAPGETKAYSRSLSIFWGAAVAAATLRYYAVSPQTPGAAAGGGSDAGRGWWLDRSSRR